MIDLAPSKVVPEMLQQSKGAAGHLSLLRGGPCQVPRKQPGGGGQNQALTRAGVEGLGGGVEGGDVLSGTKRRAERGCPEGSATRTIPSHLPRLCALSPTLAQSCVFLQTPARPAKAAAAVAPEL